VNPLFLENEISGVKAVISATASLTDAGARSVISDLVGAGGKFLRPKILVLSAMTGKYDPEKIRPLAAAVELRHTATLVHVDVIDDSPFRRGLPAAHTRIGRRNAVLAGDFLFSRCFLLAADSTSPGNAVVLARAINVMVSAELSQDADRWKFSPSIRSCVRKMGGKTAVLFSLAARAGATEAGARLPVISALSRAAWSAGIAFQMQDDILDWVADEKELGKTVMNDLAEGFCTLPLAFALSSEQGRLLPLLNPEAVCRGSSPEVASLVKSSGGIERASMMAQKYLDRSLKSLENLPSSFARDQLAQIFSSFLKRPSAVE
jgi:heptaprenyl diphosphate synthase